MPHLFAATLALALLALVDAHPAAARAPAEPALQDPALQESAPTAAPATFEKKRKRHSGCNFR
jgi:hypothetical protein